MSNNKIDFVITWVDGSDENWLKEKALYNPDKNADVRKNRYRNWENLKYWFRGVEKFAPWINKVFFVTWGHLPEWLNVNNEKLQIVNHNDYIPKKYLPTFSSRTIDLNFQRIEDLSENFVYFNDDMFLINKVKESDFFKNNIPCDTAILSPIIASKREDFAKTLCTNMEVINSNFKKNECIKQNLTKWINPKYGKNLLRTVCLLPWRNFSGFYDTHLPISFNKSTYNKVWKKEREILDFTSENKFRNSNVTVNNWIMRYWQLASGNFYPRSPKIGKLFEYGKDKDIMYQAIEKQKYKMVCLNDVGTDYNFEEEKKKTIDAFEKILPQKSSFEK